MLLSSKDVPNFTMGPIRVSCSIVGLFCLYRCVGKWQIIETQLACIHQQIHTNMHIHTYIYIST